MCIRVQKRAEMRRNVHGKHEKLHQKRSGAQKNASKARGITGGGMGEELSPEAAGQVPKFEIYSK